VDDAEGYETARRLGYEAAAAQFPELLSVLLQWHCDLHSGVGISLTPVVTGVTYSRRTPQRR
jgi:hypothetical protein